MPQMALPPGAELVSSNEMKLPPGAELVGKGVYASPGRKPGQEEANQKYIDENTQHDADGFLASAFKTSGLQGLWDAANAIHEGRAPIPSFEHPLMTGLRMIGAIPAQLKETGEKVGQQLADENYSGAAGSVAGVVAPLLVPGAAKAVTESAPAAIVRGAVKAGGKDLLKGSAKIGAGAVLDTAGVSHGVGTVLGVREGMGDLLKGGKAAIEGGKAGLDRFRTLQRQAQQPGRPIPAWMQEPVQTAQPSDVQPIQGPPALPSGRKPGGIQNQQNQPAPVPAGPAAAVAVDPLDTVAADLGYKKPYSKLTASQQMEVKVAMKVAEQEAAKAVSPASPVSPVEPNISQEVPAPQNTAFEDAYNKALERLKAKGEVPPDFARGKSGGELDGPAHFDESRAGAAVIDSTKSRFNRPVANPDLLKLEQLTQHIERLEKKPNRTPGETNLLNQLRDEVKKRGTK